MECTGRRTASLVGTVVAAAVLAACSASTSGDAAPVIVSTADSSSASTGPHPDPVLRLTFAGDVMLGRDVGDVLASDPKSLFEAVRHTLHRADLAVANLEAPFGTPAAHDPLRLVAAPGGAVVLAEAGFDAMAIANNHAGDAGPHSVPDTIDRLRSEGLSALGRAAPGAAHPAPVIVERNGRRIALLAFDMTRQGPAGIAHWEVDRAEAAIRAARAEADVVTVGLHGGVEYSARPDPALRRAVDAAAAWGADVVWAHGAHVVYDVVAIDPDGDGRSAVVAYGLGNFLFDQRHPRTERGLLLEVIVAHDGVAAYRIGDVTHEDLRVSAPQWRMPVATAALFDDGWWNVIGGAPIGAPDPGLLGTPRGVGEVTAAAVGDVDGDGTEEAVVAFLRPYRPTLVNQRLSDGEWTDAEGRTAHLGVYDRATLRQRWVAGTLARPVVALAVCDGGVAVGYGSFDGPGVVAAGAWRWRDFGFVVSEDLDGPALVGCVDVDGDRSSDPVVQPHDRGDVRPSPDPAG